MARELHDVVVVGSGSAGGWAAKDLTERGLRVMVLEAGPELDFERDLRAREPTPDARWRERRLVQSRHLGCAPDNQHLFIDDVENPYTTPPDKPFDWIRARQVGGRTLLWGRVTPRLSDYELGAAELDGFGDSWPIRHRDLAPYYDRVEEFLGVCGSVERLLQLPDGTFRPAMALTAAERRFKTVVETRFPDRKVIPARGIDQSSPPASWPRWTSQGSTLAAAAATGRLTLRANAIAHHIAVDPRTGLASGVVFLDRLTRKEELASGRVVVCCASTIETTRLLLNSKSPQHPAGLGNSSGVLGHYLMDHLLVRIAGVAPADTGPLGDEFGGPRAIYVPRFRNLELRHPAFLRGYGIYGAVQRIGIPWAQPQGDAVPFILAANAEQLPRFENQVTVRPDVTDAWGIPVAHIECARAENEALLVRDALAEMREMAHAAGYVIQHELLEPMTPGWMVHEVGTARMGDDPKRSVLNRWNQSWDVKNLFVTDGACWVTSGYQNPALTLMAITARACDHLADQMIKRNL